MIFLLILALVVLMVGITFVVARLIYGRQAHAPKATNNSTIQEDLNDKAVKNPDIERIQDPHDADPHTPEVVVPSEKSFDLNSPISGRIMRDGRYRRVTSNDPDRKKDQDFRRPGPS